VQPPSLDSAVPPEPDLPVSFVEDDDFVLELGQSAGAAVSREAKPKEPVGDRVEKKDPAEAIEEIVDEASSVTTKVERGKALYEDLADGSLEVAQINNGIDALIGLLDRLDREGKHEDALRVARTLSKLLALARRWLDLLRALRTALRAGELLGHAKTIAWAKHELGTVKLVTGDVGGAAQDLGEAREIRERVGDRRGAKVTDSNLRTLCEQLRGLPRDGRRRILRLSVPLAILIALLLAAAGIAGGMAIAGGDGGHDGPIPSGRLLTVKTAGEGSGTIYSNPAGIDCGSDCKEAFADGEKVTLTAAADDGSYFKGFSGGGCDDDNQCSLRMKARRSITATFEPGGELTVAIEGHGTITGGTTDGSTNVKCSAGSERGTYGSDSLPRARGNACSGGFQPGTAIVLSPVAEPGWEFESVEGCDEPCQVSAGASKQVTFYFVPAS
jgi:Divergent InlB B-repeat domain